jgi:hypothetical protein
MSIFYSFGAFALWLPVLCLFGLGLLAGILLRWWAQTTRVYSGTLFKLCHQARSSDLVWVAAFNQCTAQLPMTFGPALLSPPPPTTPYHPLPPPTPSRAPRGQIQRHVDRPPQHHHRRPRCRQIFFSSALLLSLPRNPPAGAGRHRVERRLLHFRPLSPRRARPGRVCPPVCSVLRTTLICWRRLPVP